MLDCKAQSSLLLGPRACILSRNQASAAERRDETAGHPLRVKAVRKVLGQEAEAIWSWKRRTLAEGETPVWDALVVVTEKKAVGCCAPHKRSAWGGWWSTLFTG